VPTDTRSLLIAPARTEPLLLMTHNPLLDLYPFSGSARDAACKSE
jgi:hypothetical protein